jgi:hypothetical protein
MTYGGDHDGWKNHIFREVIGFGLKKGACIHTSSLAKDDDPQCFSFHPWQIKAILIELITLMQ